MKKFTTFTLAVILTILFCSSCETENTRHFKSEAEAKAFFLKLDEEQKRAIKEQDSLWFANNFVDDYVNCTPSGIINNKKDEIKTLLSLPLKNYETLPQYQFFEYSGNLAVLSVINRISNDTGDVVIYNRRTKVFKLIDEEWKCVSAQGTLVPAEFIEKMNEEKQQ